jgi:E3 ubiquitin-protein ligase MARCH5
VYWCATSYGALALFQIVGLEGGIDTLKQTDSLILGFVLPLIPTALITSRFVNWQLHGLHVWRKYWPKLKGWMGYENNEGNQRRSEPQRKPAQVNKPGADAVSMSRIVIGALALPSCAALLGYTLYGNLMESYTKRSLLGGLTFVLVKGIVKMYYQEQQYIRQSQRRILDYTI